MFDLSDADLRVRILGCADGPASFNTEATARGTDIVSCDPLYQWSADQVRARIAATYETVLEQTRRNADGFVWDAIASVENLGVVRRAAMDAFLTDYEAGRSQGRYVAAALPTLPFTDDTFDLALCSHFLFLYSDQLGALFHRTAVLEMCRIAREVRIFPLVALNGRRSAYVDPLAESLRAAGHGVSMERVPYEFQRGANEMMRIRTKS
jgi:SAM-dependent methyltransferase